MYEVKRIQNRRRTRARSEIAVRDVVDRAPKGHFEQAGKWAKMRRCRRVGSRCFVNEAHDIIAVSTIVDSSDP